MQWLRTIVREVYGLFVDDGRFALAIVAWLAAARLVLPKVAAGWQGVLLAGGLVVILIENSLRSAARPPR
jgi:hypothetical protein